VAARLALREVHTSDIALFFEQQRDPRCHWMAAFTPGAPEDWAGFAAHWHRLLSDPGVQKRAVLVDGEGGRPPAVLRAAGPARGELLDRSGLARAARGEHGARPVLAEIDERPLHARVARDHLGSLRVLQRNGFAVCREGRGYSAVRGGEIGELILRLGA
jgi:RimJ/RimL family protein N-acetyltransferase